MSIYPFQRVNPDVAMTDASQHMDTASQVKFYIEKPTASWTTSYPFQVIQGKETVGGNITVLRSLPTAPFSSPIAKNRLIQLNNSDGPPRKLTFKDYVTFVHEFLPQFPLPVSYRNIGR
jgi:hypothetical protein